MVDGHYLAISIFLLTACVVSTATGNTASPYSVDFDLRNMIGFNDNAISADDIFAFIQEKYPNSPMLNEADIGDCFINAGESNNVNPAFLVATSDLEGRFGTAGWAASNSNCHNTLGYDIADTGPGSYSCASSWCAMINRVASVIANGNNYYTQGRYTVSQVRKKYATESNSGSIANLMNELYKFSENRNGGSSAEPQSQPVPVTLTLYVHEGDRNGPSIPDAQVTGQDGSGNVFMQTTGRSGSVTITGDPGTWAFEASADGYETNSWNQDITDTCTKHAFLMKSVATITTQDSENSIIGKWTINYPNCTKDPDCGAISGDCAGDCSPSIVTFNDDGTFTYSTGETGKWIQHGDIVQFLTDDTNTPIKEPYLCNNFCILEGTIKSNTMNGILWCPHDCDHKASLGDTTGLEAIPRGYGDWIAYRVGTDGISADASYSSSMPADAGEEYGVNDFYPHFSPEELRA